MKKLFLIAFTLNLVSGSDGFFSLHSHSSEAKLNSSMMATSMRTDANYDIEAEYQRHQEVHERFFRRKTVNKEAIKFIQIFKKELEEYKSDSLSPIDLDGMSSRTRVLLLRELISAAKEATVTIPFSLNGKSFHLMLKPEEHQKGFGLVSNIGLGVVSNIDNIWPIISSFKDKQQKKFVDSLKKARSKSENHQKFSMDYHRGILNSELKVNGEVLDLEILDFCIDFEVARRLIGTQAQEDTAHYVTVAQRDPLVSSLTEAKTSLAKALDSVPVGSALVGMLKLGSLRVEDPNYVPLESFFFTPNSEERLGVYFGEYNPFKGQAVSNPREMATKKIIRKMRGGDNAYASTKEQIHQEYLDIFGGESESEEDGDKRDYDGALL